MLDISVDKTTTTFFPIPIELFGPFLKGNDAKGNNDPGTA